MNKRTLIPALALVAAACLAIPAFNHGEAAEGAQREGHRGAPATQAASNEGDIDKLYELVRQSRADLDDLRKMAGIARERRGHREGRGEHGGGHGEGRGEHGGRHREGHGEHGGGHREGRGEHAGGHREGHAEGNGEGHEEEGGTRIGKHETWDRTRNGARLILAYDAATQSFRGTVQNTTSKTLSEVRVEVHLSNGVELGPTKRVDLKPGEKITVELSAANQQFTRWTTHPETGTEEGHGPGHEREGAGEHGGADGNRPKDPALRPLYNQLQLLRQEIKMVKEGLAKRRRW